MPQPAGQTLRMFRGNTFTFVGTVTQDSSAFNLTDCDLTLTAKWRMSDDQSDAVFTCIVGDGITLTTPASGIFTAVIDADKTSGLPNDPNKPVVLFYDIELVDTGGAVYTILFGKLIVKPTVTTVPA